MRKVLLSMLGAAAILSSCTRDYELDPQNENATGTQTAQVSQATGIPGIAYVQVKRPALSSMRVAIDGELSRSSLPTEMSATLESIEAYRIEPLFPADPRFEKRHKAAGLDLWYEIHFNEKTDLGEALAKLSSVNDFSIVEQVYPQSRPAYKMEAFNVSRTEKDPRFPYDDPRLPSQWHYKNFGTGARSVAGADANIFEAWEIETGKPEVIICIVDGGVDLTHEDLEGAFWTNPNEIPGNGKDDDGNKYIDDIHGYSFVGNDSVIVADDHGTHVAGTVAARNNNGKGLCGVAGGDGRPESGVRIMSCEIFRGKNGRGSSEKAIVYGADNGAVISQNSWGYKYPGGPASIPKSLKAAIDYFTTYAGCDNEGKQLPGSPMKGGVVIFAAGNDGIYAEAYPGAYEGVIAVSAMAPNWKRAYYTERGEWIDIMAPGGDEYFPGGMVYSTVPTTTSVSGYAAYQGTSMACPHVSGIAGLVVSKFGGDGFTADQLKQRLLGALRPHNIDLENPQFAGTLGRGYIDAAEALSDRTATNNKAPQDVKEITAEPRFIDMTVSWKAVADPDDKMPVEYLLYVSETAITATNYKPLQPYPVNGFGIPAGEMVSKKIEGLKESTTYYVGLIAVDRWGATSTIQTNSFKTLKNRAPEISGMPKDLIRVSGTEKQTFTLTLSDPDGHVLRHKVGGETKGVSVVAKDNKLIFTVRAIAPKGMHKISVTATDELGLATTIEVPFEVYVYEAPSVIANMKNATIGMNDGSKNYDLLQYFKFQEGAKVTFTASSSNSGVATAKIEGNALKVAAQKPGKATITVTLSDAINTPVQTKFEVRVVENSADLVYAAYPIPAKDDLNLLFNPEVTSAQFLVHTVLGEKVLDSKISGIFEGTPVKVNLRKLAPGNYTLTVKTNKGSYKKAFIKL